MTAEGHTAGVQARAGYNPPLVLAIDVGSSSVKAALYDAQAHVVAGTEASQGHMLHATTDGAAEEIAEHVVERVERVVDRVLERAGDAVQHIAAVGLDTLASTVLGVEQEGQPVTPIYTYADTRSRDYVDELRRELDVRAVYQRTGCPQHTAYLPARLRWVKRDCPDIASRVHRWMDVGTHLYIRWFGRKDIPASYSIASWSGLLNRHHNRWDQELLDFLSVSVSSLPLLADYTSAQQGLAEPFARRWPALRDVPFFLPVGDGAAANVGSGCVSPGRVALTVGTSGALRVLLPHEVSEIPPGLWAYRLGATQTLLGGSFSEGGNVFAWARGTLRLPQKEELESALQSLSPDSHGLTVLPFLAGERSPGWSTSAAAAIEGLKVSTTPLQILHAFLEAIAFRFRHVADMLKRYVDQECQIIASGGAVTGSPYWLQVMADVLQRPVVVSSEKEDTSRGTAILALHALGIWPTLDTVPAELGNTYWPNPQRAPVYQRGIERQHRLYDALVGHDAEIGQRLAQTTQGIANEGEVRPGGSASCK